MKPKLWTRNFTLITSASAMGAAGGIAGGFAMSFLVFEETGSTLAAALIAAIQLIPYFVLPIFLAPLMDRLPRKPFLICGDIVNGILYALMGIYLLKFEFTYTGYLAYSLLLATLGSFDQLAYNSLYPNLIPEGMEQKGYAVSSTLYPVLQVTMMPLAGVLTESLGAAWLLIAQGFLSLCAAATESFIRIKEVRRMEEAGYGFKQWREDIREAAHYLKKEKGLTNLYAYMAVTNGMASGYSPILVAFFSTVPGLSAALYALFSVAEFLGRTLGGLVQYRIRIPNKRKFGFAFFVYQLYEAMDMCLLWLPYPLMLLNRGICGFLGTNSATMRAAAVQKYIPDHLRARVNAFQEMLIVAACSILSLLVGALGEVLDLRLCVTLCAGISLAACWLTVWRRRREIGQMYMYETEVNA